MSEPAEAVEMRAALLRLRRSTGIPIAFGGLLGEAQRLRIAQLSGARTSALQGLSICAGNGLGGKSIALSRPCAVTDYHEARHISHEYDAPVLAEGLRSVLAVPVVVRRKVRGVLYGALRRPVPLGDRTFDEAVAAARDVEQALVVREEVQGLLSIAREPRVGPAVWEEVREVHGELRALAPRVSDPVLRGQLLAVCGRLAAAGATAHTRSGPPWGGESGARAAGGAVALAPREIDVLACVAAGSTNAAAAERLGLRPETVKGYLRAAMRKLGAHTRLEAVVAARRVGLLP
ncbi:helix-turn-helix transcriptional regulator [Streptomyces sp. NPDC000594]|uniref:helix-turn-helix transcriptional regulator n=1 Tax=Streptomyces sp. NPDC000594 TaxID=3154261 RepID=UPI00331BD089